MLGLVVLVLSHWGTREKEVVGYRDNHYVLHEHILQHRHTPSANSHYRHTVADPHHLPLLILSALGVKTVNAREKMLDDGSEVYTGNQKPEGRMSASRAQRGRYTARGFLISRIHRGNPSSNLFIPWQHINRVLSNPQPMVSTATNSAAHMSLLRRDT